MIPLRPFPSTWTGAAVTRNGSLIWGFLLVWCGPAAGQNSPSRVQALLRQMSLAEKVGLLHGAHDPNELGQAGYWPGLPRLGIPPMRFADGPPWR